MWTDSETQDIRYNVIYTYIIFFTLTIHISLLKSLLITSKNKKSFDIIYQHRKYSNILRKLFILSK